MWEFICPVNMCLTFTSGKGDRITGTVCHLGAWLKKNNCDWND